MDALTEELAKALLVLAGRPNSWPLLTDYEKDCWQQIVEGYERERSRIIGEHNARVLDAG